MQEKNSQQTPEAPSRRSKGPILLALALACATGFGLIEAVRERRQARELAASRDEMSAALSRAQGDIQALSAKLDAMRAASQIPAPAASVKHRRPASRPAEDPRWKQLQARLSEQQRQIETTRKELDSAREDLAGKLNATHDELSGSIARNHEELVALQKRGERTYHEFQLTKSKQFQRIGPISLSLRKANTKRKSYDLAMIVDDMQLQKKSVNLYEPVLINLGGSAQPLELVVNKISKDEIQGYLSEPKYKKSELASAPPGPAPPSPR
jgi:hypothetical protein